MAVLKEITPAMIRKTIRYRYIVMGIVALAYFFVLFHRMSTAVMAPDLSADFGIDLVQVGLFGSMYFYAYAMSQLACGILADRWGARKTMSVFLLVAGVATLLFGLTDSFYAALGARFMVGLGVAFLYVPALRLLADWFKPNEYATHVGFLIAIGNIGGLAASAPLVILMTAFGWRNTMISIGVITLLIAALLYILVRNHPAEIGGAHPSGIVKSNAEPTPQKSISQVFKILIRKYNFWTIVVLNFGWVGTLMAIQGLWAGPYLMNVYHLNKQESGNILMFISFGAIIGCCLIGFIADRFAFTTKKLVMTGVFGTILTLVPLVFFIDAMSLNFIRVVMFFFGFFSYANLLIWPNLRENVETSMLGTASGLVNFFGFFGGALFQQGLGFIIARSPLVEGYLATSAFKSAFLFCFVYLIIALAVFSTQREVHLRPPIS